MRLITFLSVALVFGILSGFARAANLVGYYQPVIDRAFFTGNPDEIRVLDGGAFGGWIRTPSDGLSELVTGGGAPVCRYWSDVSASHFWSFNCALAAGDLNWFSEGVSFHAEMPFADQTCPLGWAGVRYWVNSPRNPRGASYRFVVAGSDMERRLHDAGWNMGNVEFCLEIKPHTAPPQPGIHAGQTQLDIKQNEIAVVLGFAGEAVLSFLPATRTIRLGDISQVCIDSNNLGWGNDSARCIAPDASGIAAVKNTVTNDCFQVHLKLKDGSLAWANLDKLEMVGRPARKVVNGETQCLAY